MTIHNGSMGFAKNSGIATQAFGPATTSGMSRSMSGGRKAYVTKLGRPALAQDLVDIFDYAEPNCVGSVTDQQVFHSKWVESLRE